MEELTPEQKKIQEEIQKRVGFLKFVRSHVRWAGIVVQLVGIFAHSTPVLMLGTFVFIASYMWAQGIIEEITIAIWDRPDEPKDEEEEAD